MCRVRENCCFTCGETKRTSARKCSIYLRRVDDCYNVELAHTTHDCCVKCRWLDPQHAELSDQQLARVHRQERNKGRKTIRLAKKAQEDAADRALFCRQVEEANHREAAARAAREAEQERRQEAMLVRLAEEDCIARKARHAEWVARDEATLARLADAGRAQGFNNVACQEATLARTAAPRSSHGGSNLRRAHSTSPRSSDYTHAHSHPSQSTRRGRTAQGNDFARSA